MLPMTVFNPFPPLKPSYPLLFSRRGASVRLPSPALASSLPELHHQWRASKQPTLPCRILENLSLDLDPYSERALSLIIRYLELWTLTRTRPNILYDTLERCWEDTLQRACCGPMYAIQLLVAIGKLLDVQVFGCGQDLFQQFVSFATKHSDAIFRDRNMWPCVLRALDRMAGERNLCAMRSLLQIAVREIILEPRMILEICRRHQMSFGTLLDLQRFLQLDRVHSYPDLQSLKRPRLGDVGRSHSYPMIRRQGPKALSGSRVHPEVLQDIAAAAPEALMVSTKVLPEFGLSPPSQYRLPLLGPERHTHGMHILPGAQRLLEI